MECYNLKLLYEVLLSPKGMKLLPSSHLEDMSLMHLKKESFSLK